MTDARPEDLLTQGPPDAGDSPASEPGAWLDLHGDVLFRYALSRVRTHDLAEELVQETLVAALQARKQFSGRSSEQTWMIGILRRKIVDHIRKRTRQAAAEEPEEIRKLVSESFDHRGFWKTRLPKWPADPAGALEQREFWDVFDECVSKLPASLTGTFCLHDLEQLKCDEVCKVLGISASNVWTKLHRARMLLRRCLELNWFADER